MLSCNSVTEIESFNSKRDPCVLFLGPFRCPFRNYSGRHHLDATNKMTLYPLPHKSIEKKFFLLDSD